MKINPLTSKTIIGAILAALGFLAGSPEFGSHKEIIQQVATLLEAVGGVLFAWGVRHAIAKSADGIVQLHPLSTVLALLFALPLLAATGSLPRQSNAPPLNPAHFANYSWDDQLAGDSMKVLLYWGQPPDTVAKGKIDSTVYSVKVSLPTNYYNANVVPASSTVRRVKTTFADSLRLAKPIIGSTVTVQVTGFIQCRQGDCSVPGSGAFSYKHTYAPPPTAPNIKYDVY